MNEERNNLFGNQETPEEKNITDQAVNENNVYTAPENTAREDSANDYSSQAAESNPENYQTAEPVQNVEETAQTTEDDAPKVEAEPVYSPYSQAHGAQQGFAQQPYSRYNDTFNQQSTVNTGTTKKKNKGFKAFIIALVAVVACVAIVLVSVNVWSNRNKTSKDQVNGDSTQISINNTPTSSNKTGNLSIEEIAANAKKYNVGILLYGSKQSSFSSSASSSLVGEGSGIIMKEDSTGKYTYILTCAHVISGVKTSGYSMSVQDCDGNTYDGILVGYDEKTDVGVIKIEKTGLNCAEFGDSSALTIGQTVYAIGNPGGTEFFGSFTDGIVSSIDRPISSESGYEMKCIQHTAAINSGNSGGALLNAYGQVIGINSSKIVSTGYEGMAFAIPISDAQAIINDIISNGYVTNRPKLGISYAAATNYQQYSMIVKLKDLPSGSLIIASISADSSLAKTDAKVGDLITAVDGKKLDDANVLLDRIQNGKVGDTMKLSLCRIGSDYSISTFDVTVTLIEDTGSNASADEEQTTTQNYWEQYFNGGY